MEVFSDLVDQQKFVVQWIQCMFRQVRWFFIVLFVLYLPFLYSLYEVLMANRNNQDESSSSGGFNLAYIILWTAKFLVTEGIQLYHEGWQYFNSFDNLLETAQIVSNSVLVCAAFGLFRVIAATVLAKIQPHFSWWFF